MKIRSNQRYPDENNWRKSEFINQKKGKERGNTWSEKEGIWGKIRTLDWIKSEQFGDVCFCVEIRIRRKVGCVFGGLYKQVDQK